ncbi:MAG: nitroreductase family protein [Paracoccaceae bacterium]
METKTVNSPEYAVLQIKAMETNEMQNSPPNTLQYLLQARFSDAPKDVPDLKALHPLAARGSCRTFQEKAIPHQLVEILCAVAFAAPTKSDLQQRDIVILQDPKQKAALAALVSGQTWVADAPMIAVFCGNNRRQRQIHGWYDVPFANDHFDAVFNATADAALALGAFVYAAEAIGLGCCPISAVRNEAASVSRLLNLPAYVFPFAGLAFGYPSAPPQVSQRLPLSVTYHVDHFSEDNVQTKIQDYDTSRRENAPYQSQRFPETFGHSPTYGWSDDKMRQYSQPERADFGAYLRAMGFVFE